jgi:hypothetical protein
MDLKLRSARNSFLRLWWKRSIFPVVVGARTAVRRCEIPFSRHSRLQVGPVTIPWTEFDVWLRGEAGMALDPESGEIRMLITPGQFRGAMLPRRTKREKREDS